MIIEYGPELKYEEVMNHELLLEVFKHQTILDAEFLKVANRRPELGDRADAAFDEAAEFVAEFKSINKYWANKETDLSKVLDEHSDIVHFVVGYYIARGLPARMLNYALKSNYNLLIAELETEDYDLPDWKKIRFYLRKIRKTDSFIEALAAATIVIGMCGFDKDDVLEQYRKKRDENYRRIAKTAKGEVDR